MGHIRSRKVLGFESPVALETIQKTTMFSYFSYSTTFQLRSELKQKQKRWYNEVTEVARGRTCGASYAVVRAPLKVLCQEQWETWNSFYLDMNIFIFLKATLVYGALSRAKMRALNWRMPSICRVQNWASLSMNIHFSLIPEAASLRKSISAPS